MFKNYLLVTFRNLYKNKVYALINILGLGLALAICIVAYFNHMFGYDFDRYHENFEEIYRVTFNRQMQDREQEFGLVPAPLGPEIKKDFPAVSKAARIMRSRRRRALRSISDLPRPVRPSGRRCRPGLRPGSPRW